jgi:hypothetical protein
MCAAARASASAGAPLPGAWPARAGRAPSSGAPLAPLQGPPSLPPLPLLEVSEAHVVQVVSELVWELDGQEG